MTNLLQDLAASKEPSRELDARIHGWRMHYQIQRFSNDGAMWVKTERDAQIKVSRWPHYTSNLQDALKLVPNGWLWRVQWNGKLFVSSMYDDFIAGEYSMMEHKANPALALSAAAVQAGMIQKEQRDD